jgi:hypothetical protein
LPVLSRACPPGYFRKVQGDFISLKAVLAYLDSGQEFELSCVTIGGEWLHLKGIKHSGLPAAEYKKQQQLQPASNLVKKDPRHYENCTRNVRLTANGEIRKVKIRLIRKFNGQTVL